MPSMKQKASEARKNLMNFIRHRAQLKDDGCLSKQ